MPSKGSQRALEGLARVQLAAALHVSGQLLQDAAAMCQAAERMRASAQVVHSPYKGFLDCLVRTVRADGIQALYRSYPTTARLFWHPFPFSFHTALHADPCPWQAPAYGQGLK